MDSTTKMCFSFIRQQLDKDNESYALKREKNRGNVMKRWNQGADTNVYDRIPDDTNVYDRKFRINSYSDNEYDNEYECEYDLKKSLSSERPKEKPESKDKGESSEYPYKEVIAYLNEKSGKAFKDKSKDTRAHIKARFAEGYTLEDFYKVIDNKVNDWKGTEMDDYLRPSTLFCSKFESYLNQNPKQAKTNQNQAKRTRFVNYEQREVDYDSMIANGDFR